MNTRDDFSAKTKRAVAARAGWKCSICDRPTVGPSDERPDAVACIGVAAHIAAAASGPGARRYDPNMTPEERAHIDNAIWLCADHAILIDRDAKKYTVVALRKIKSEHEKACDLEGWGTSGGDGTNDLVALGPNIVFSGKIDQISADSWSFQIAHFVMGDIHDVVTWIDGYWHFQSEDRYVLSLGLGDGRSLAIPPSLERCGNKFHVDCPVLSRTPRVQVQQLGRSLATDPETFDLMLDKSGNLAMVEGLNYLPQKLREILSTKRGECVFAPTFGSRFAEYLESYAGTAWVGHLLTLDIIRLASIPYRDRVLKQEYTPIRCVNRVLHVDVGAISTGADMLTMGVDLDVEGIGRWRHELKVYVPMDNDR